MVPAHVLTWNHVSQTLTALAPYPPPMNKARWTRVVGWIGLGLLLVIAAGALWNVAVGNRRLISGAVALAAGFGAWRVWPFLRGAPSDAGYQTPRWVKIAGAIALGLVLLVVGVMAFAPGEHRPGRHGPGQLGPGEHISTETDTETAEHAENSPVAEGAMRIPVRADNLSFDPSTISVRIGTNVAIDLTAVDALHDFTIDELSAHVTADQGDTATGGFHAAPPARYTYYCSVPGHREAGMEGTLVVTGGH